MKCTNHPHIETHIKCSECQISICNRCASSLKNGSIICNKCEIKLLDGEVLENIEKREAGIFDRRLTENQKQRKKKSIIRIAIAILIFTIVSANLYLYFKPSVSFWSEYKPNESSSLTILIIDSALQEYFEDHGGEYPENIDELIGEYIHSDDLSQNELIDISYFRYTPYTYELSLIESSSEPLSHLIFTESGLK